jgi:hypothetical protein
MNKWKSDWNKHRYVINIRLTVFSNVIKTTKRFLSFHLMLRLIKIESFSILTEVTRLHKQSYLMNHFLFYTNYIIPIPCCWLSINVNERPQMWLYHFILQWKSLLSNSRIEFWIRQYYPIELILKKSSFV